MSNINLQNKNYFELRYYNGAKHIFDYTKEYFVSGIYELKETKNQYNFVFLENKSNSPFIPSKKDLKFSKNKGWSLKTLSTLFYPEQAGIPHWFVEI